MFKQTSGNVASFVAAQVLADREARKTIAYVHRTRNYRQSLIRAGIISNRAPEYGTLDLASAEFASNLYRIRVMGVKLG